MNNSKLQAIIATALGDGHIRKLPSENVYLIYSSISKEYIKYKNQLLETDAKISKVRNKGYKENWIYSSRTKNDVDVLSVYNMSLKTKLENLDKLGLAIWFLDDGSLHKSKLFYNLNTHSFSEKDHIEVLLPYFRSLQLNPILRKDVKKDGKLFFYICFNKRDNAVWISDIIQELCIEFFNYKVFPSNAFLKGYNYNGNYFLELKDYSIQNNIPLHKLMSLRQKHEINIINYLDVQRLSKPSFFN